MDSHYPGRLRKIYIVNAPWGFSSIFGVIKAALPPAVRDAMEILSNVKDLHKFIKPDQVGTNYSMDMRHPTMFTPSHTRAMVSVRPFPLHHSSPRPMVVPVPSLARPRSSLMAASSFCPACRKLTAQNRMTKNLGIYSCRLLRGIGRVWFFRDR